MDDKVGERRVDILKPDMNDQARIQKSLLTGLAKLPSPAAILVPKSHFDGTILFSGDSQASCNRWPFGMVCERCFLTISQP